MNLKKLKKKEQELADFKVPYNKYFRLLGPLLPIAFFFFFFSLLLEFACLAGTQPLELHLFFFF
jgi:hypothetical protein